MVNYNEHLRSPYWQAVRRVVRQRADGCCQRCGTNSGPFDVDHLTYEFLGTELEHLETVQYLCRDCHRYKHGRTSFDPRRYMACGGEDEILKLMREMGL